VAGRALPTDKRKEFHGERAVREQQGIHTKATESKASENANGVHTEVTGVEDPAREGS